MITAVDTSVLLDVFKADARFGPLSRRMLQRCIREGRVVACEVVYAELGAVFGSSEQLSDAMQRLGVQYEPIGRDAAIAAGEAFRAYREQGGTRARVVADFLIGAHARGTASRLLTRDRGFHQRYFDGLQVLDPSDER